jgi:hypothetical protein
MSVYVEYVRRVLPERKMSRCHALSACFLDSLEFGTGAAACTLCRVLECRLDTKQKTEVTGPFDSTIPLCKLLQVGNHFTPDQLVKSDNS